jgi:tetratricopeptide (TPR) repeat protein
MEEKPQAKTYPENNECQAPIMDDPFLLLLLCFGFGRERRFEGGSIAHIFAALVTVIVALWHLGVAERAHLHHGHSFPQAGTRIGSLLCWHHPSWSISVQRCLVLLPCILLLCCCLPQTLVAAHAEPVPAPDTLPPTFALMRDALHQALQLRFTAALEVAVRLEQPSQHLLEAQLVRGIIAYFQARWQIPLPPTTRQDGLKGLATLLEAGQRQLMRSPRTPRLQLVLGLAAIFQGLLQQQSGASLDFALLAQGRTWLQQALTAHETIPDAHLGLGLWYFLDLGRPVLLPRIADRAGNDNTTEAIYHLRQAAESGHFSGEVARTFLVHVYELEKRYQEAITLGQALQATFPGNGYYALVSGRSQCAQGQYALCATILGQLAADLQTAVIAPLSRDDRFDLYYFWGQALYETGQDALAFEAFRQATNQDPGNTKDASLWAKYYLGILYERRGAVKTARQLYHTLLRGRNVDDLHQQVEQRLAQLREG